MLLKAFLPPEHLNAQKATCVQLISILLYKYVNIHICDVQSYKANQSNMKFTNQSSQ